MNLGMISKSTPFYSRGEKMLLELFEECLTKDIIHNAQKYIERVTGMSIEFQGESNKHFFYRTTLPCFILSENGLAAKMLRKWNVEYERIGGNFQFKVPKKFNSW